MLSLSISKCCSLNLCYAHRIGVLHMVVVVVVVVVVAGVALGHTLSDDFVVNI